MSERDELLDILEAAGMQSPYYHEAQADAILAAGYRKPHIITAREELDALPVGAAIIDDEPPIWLWTKCWVSKHPRKDGTPLSKWRTRGDDDERETHEIPLPVTVVWVPISAFASEAAE